MAKGMKLKAALDNFKQVDHKLEQQRRLEKKAEKRKRSKAATEDEEVVSGKSILKSATSQEAPKASKRQKTGKSSGVLEAKPATDDASESETWATDDSGTEDGSDVVMSTGNLMDSDDSSDSEIEFDQNGAQVEANGDGGDDEEDEGEEDDDIPLSDVESLASEDKADIITHQRLTINNKPALLKAYKSIALPKDLPFSANQVIVTEEAVVIKDIDDDLNRELAFYKQSLDAVTRARSLLKAEGAPFSRPSDYFAEMVKTEEHMGRIKSKLVGEAASKKAAAEARKQRDLKKFGKQVQIAKLQERDRTKRETLDKIKMLKKKRSGADITNTNEDDMFDVALEEGTDGAKSSRRDAGGRPKMPRNKRDEKYGFGGKKRFSKSNDATSTSDTRSFSAKRMKAGKSGSSRPGKSKRANRRD